MDPLNVGIYEDDQESIEEHKKKLKQMQIKLRDAASAYENITTRYNKHDKKIIAPTLRTH